MGIVNKILLIIETLLMIIIGIAVFIVLFNFIQLKLLKKDYVSFFNHSVFEVVSNSMSPTINKGDVIIIKDTDNIEVDDIVTYKLEDKFVTHRVIQIKRDKLILKGDSNNSADVPIEEEKIIGKVIKIVPNVGVWRNVFMTPKVLAAAILTLLIFNYLVANTKVSSSNLIRKNKDFKITHKSIIEDKNDRKK